MAELAGALDSIELDNVQAPYSQTLETPEGGRPFYKESDDGTGWIGR